MKNIPHYLSTFDLEEARLGQALGRCKIHFSDKQLEAIEDSGLIKLTLRKIRNESVNAEFALFSVMKDLSAHENEKAATLKEIAALIIDKLLK